MKPSRKLLLIGLGDLGSRISQLVAQFRLATDIRLLSRRATVHSWASILAVAGEVNVSSAEVDALDAGALERECEQFEPDLILQCASMLSPWAFSNACGPVGKFIGRGGFALQISAQLPILISVMRVHRALGLGCPVINCSYPDATHAMLSSEGLAPTAGIGNVAMIAAKVQRSVGGSGHASVRVIAHHGQVSRSMQNASFEKSEPEPLVYRGERCLRREEWNPASAPFLAAGVLLNHLSATTALPVIRGLLVANSCLRTHAPGIAGLPGGYPIRIADGHINLDLPRGLTVEAAINHNRAAARLDGIEHISGDGILTYTDRLRARCKDLCAELCEPLGLNEALHRWHLLKTIHDGAL